MKELSTITIGRLGYNLTEHFLLKNGFDLYVPLLEDTKIDCIAIKEAKLFKLQIKTIQHSHDGKVMPVRKLSNNRGVNKQKFYTKDEIDYFVGVDLETSDLYIVPIEFVIKYKSAISVSSLQQFKNNINILE
jgi:hypothetical protein